MLSEAALILSSVDFLENQIKQKLGEMEEAANNNLYATAELIEKQIRGLLRKINNENVEIDSFMRHYKQLIKDEKEKLLSNIK